MHDEFDKEDNYTNEFQEASVASETGITGEAGPTGEIFDLPPSLEIPEKPLFKPEQPAVNFSQERRACGTPIKDTRPIMSIIQESYRNVNKVLERNSMLLDAMHSGNLVTNEHDDIWLANLFAGMNHLSLDETPLGATERPESHWRDGISIPGHQQLVRPGRPQQVYDKSKKNSKESALAFLSWKAGLGGNYEAFLPHSGIWVRLRRPSLGEVVAMQTELQTLRVKLGNDTKGLAFSHASFRMLDAVTDLALNCIVASNRHYTTPSDLEHEMSIFDESLLHHALAAVMYPDGFNYSVPCIADPDKCNGVTEFKMNMSNVVFFDDAVFTKEQRRHIAKQFAPASDDDFKAYREAFTIGNPKINWMGEVGIKIAPPSIAKRRISAKLWYDTLIEMSKGAFNESPEGGQRYEYIRRLQHATKATQYSHWVEAIYLKDENTSNLEDQFFTDDQEIIMDFISSTISEHEYFERFVDGVNAYSNETIIGLCALPSHNCPECKSPQGLTYNERLPHLVPLDMLATFFTLAGQRVA
ncbi:hypothetical protein ST201phi2-1p136 [Pseudomonas phage 201phi2-1]|uniref:Uncharacterized protein n=1 Tax=Pseudomonas phage 201phi2-1 TaxID=198110 RepID=B3FIZ9_BP201|nr:hypothetical protein ST201phi2-1p136 [Pseudomonas phage 201phi2-1]ABY62967.1 hypothetical protein 201phi2-1p136 [Pseudomonas phage 201phi2-1]